MPATPTTPTHRLLRALQEKVDTLTASLELQLDELRASKLPQAPPEEGNLDDTGPEEEDREEQPTYREVATCLKDFVQRGEVQEPGWSEELFAANPAFWEFPRGAAKDGRLSEVGDVIALRLRDQENLTQGAISQGYQYLRAEWPVLRLSLIYSRLVGTALYQINEFIANEDRITFDECSLKSDLLHLEEIFEAITSQQLARASVIITAADHTLQGAEKVAHHFSTTKSALHPKAVPIFEALSPVKTASAAKTRESSWKSGKTYHKNKKGNQSSNDNAKKTGAQTTSSSNGAGGKQ